MATSTDLNHFRTTLIDDITDAVQNSDSGGIREEKFTQLALEYLEDAVRLKEPYLVGKSVKTV